MAHEGEEQESQTHDGAAHDGAAHDGGAKDSQTRDSQTKDGAARWWVRVLALVRQVRTGITQHNATMVAAGVAFYGILAIFPALIAIVSVYALVADPADVTRQLDPVARKLPAGAGTLLTDQLRGAIESSHSGLTAGLIFSLLGTLWAASGGINALTNGLSIIFGTVGRRPALRARALSLGLTLGGLVLAIIALVLVAVFPAVLGHLGLGPAARAGAQVLRWLLLLALVTTGLTVLYRLARAGSELPHLRRVGPVTAGVVTAVLVWVAGSVGFTIYVSNFGKYNKTYGSLAAVIVLLLWLYLSAFAVLLGAVVDARHGVGAGDGPGGDRHPAGDGQSTGARDQPSGSGPTGADTR